MVEIYEIDEIVKKANEPKDNRYEKAWKELIQILKKLRDTNIKARDHNKKIGLHSTADLYDHWAIEDDYILAKIYELEHKHKLHPFSKPIAV